MCQWPSQGDQGPLPSRPLGPYGLLDKAMLTNNCDQQNYLLFGHA